MKYLLLWFSLLVIPNCLLSQQINELVIDNEFGIGCNKIIKDYNGDFILNCGTGDTCGHISTLILKLTPEFDTTSTLINLPGFDIAFGDFIVTENNKYIFLGSYGIDGGYGYYFDYFCILALDENFEELYFKIYQLPDGYINPILKLVQAEDGKIFAGGTIRVDTTTNNDFYLIKFNETGDTLKTYLSPHTQLPERTYEILNKSGGQNGFYIFGDAFSFSSSMQVIDVDTNLNYSIIDLNTNPTGYFFGPGVGTKWLNDSIYLFSSCDNPSNNKKFFEDLFVSKMNTNHEFIGEPIWLGREDTTDYPGFNHLDYSDPDLIFLGANTAQWPLAAYQFNYFIGLIDDDLNIKGTKRIGKEHINFMFMSLCATDDGGCIFVSTKYDYINDPDYDFDLHILRLYPDDIITSASETPLEIDSDYNVYPNPGKNILNVQTARKGVTIELYDEHGLLVLKKQLADTYLNRITTTSLPPGNYIYKFTDNEGYIENGKWIKAYK